MNEQSINRCTLTVRHIRRDLVDDLYELKSISGRPVWALAETAIAYWLDEAVWPTLRPTEETRLGRTVPPSRTGRASRIIAAVARLFRWMRFQRR
jgi:hypothetical protein